MFVTSTIILPISLVLGVHTAEKDHRVKILIVKPFVAQGRGTYHLFNTKVYDINNNFSYEDLFSFFLDLSSYFSTYSLF